MASKLSSVGAAVKTASHFVPSRSPKMVLKQVVLADNYAMATDLDSWIRVPLNLAADVPIVGINPCLADCIGDNIREISGECRIEFDAGRR